MNEFIEKYNDVIIIGGLLIGILGFLINYFQDIKGKIRFTIIALCLSIIAYVLYLSFSSNQFLFWLCIHIHKDHN
jgi:hypothetical protein